MRANNQFALRASLRRVIVLLALTCLLAPSLTQAATVSFVLQWANKDTSIEGFLIERSTDAMDFSQIATVPTGSLSYEDTGLTLGVTYYYRMRAYNAAGESPYSNVVIGQTAPALAIEPLGSDSILSVSNPFAQMSNVTVVVAGEPVHFAASASGPVGAILSYAWDFGDQQTAVGINPTHTFAATNCQSYSVNVVVSDGTSATTETITVATPCPLDVMMLQMKSNFAHLNADSFHLIAAMDLPDGFNPAGQILMVNVGNVLVQFHLDHSGKGTGVYGTCKLANYKGIGQAILIINLHGGNWQAIWADDGLLDQPAVQAPISVPVAVMVGNNAFAAEQPLHYTAFAGQFGVAH